MHVPVIFDGNDFLIPINPFFDIINALDINNFILDSSEKYISSFIIPSIIYCDSKCLIYHFKIAEAHVNPDPNDAKTTISPLDTFPSL